MTTSQCLLCGNYFKCLFFLFQGFYLECFFTVSGFKFKLFLFFPVSGYSRVRFCFEGSAAAETETHDQKESSSCNPHTGLKQIKQKYPDLLWAFPDLMYPRPITNVSNCLLE